jgi:hypothetical protein
MIHRLFLAFLFAFLAKVSVDAVNRDAPHGHTGKMKPYVAGPFGMKLKAKDEETLSKGNPVMKQLPPDDPTDKLGGKAICVQDVEAPKSAIWRQILDMDSYVGKVMKVKECKNYVVKDNGNGTMQLKTKMVLGVLPGYSVRSISISVLYGFVPLTPHFKTNLGYHAVHQLLRPLFQCQKGIRDLVSRLRQNI